MNCPTGKVRHVDRAAALAVKGRLGYGNKVDPYHCPDCDGWHLGGHHRRGDDDPLQQIHQFSGPGKPIGGTTIGDRDREYFKALDEDQTGSSTAVGAMHLFDGRTWRG
jgi:hypothetical protein